MGTGYMYKCKKCGYTFSQMNGVGLLFPAVYAETVLQAKDGELGKEIQQFFEEHHNGAVNAENATLCCNSCGALTMGRDLTMFIPKKNCPSKIKNTRWSVGIPFEGCEYVTKDELKEFYEEYAKYPHKCEKCSSEMRVLKDDEDLICPECKNPFGPTTNIIMWD